MRTVQLSIVERIIFQARAAARCREAAREESNPNTRASLMRAADRYSESVGDLASELVSRGNP